MSLDSILSQSSGKHEISMNCPMCASKGKTDDTKNHLSINIKKGVFQCFRCGWKGKLGPNGLKEFELLSEQFIPEDNQLNALSNIVNNLFIPKELNKYDINKISWPIDQIKTPYAYAYLHDRGISDTEMVEHNIRVGTNYNEGEYEIKRWCGRILFPFYNSVNECIYIVGRSYAGREPRYLNCTNNKEYVVYGLNRINDGETVIMCEGIISAMAAERYTGVKSIAVLGKMIMNSQLSLIRNKTDKIIVSVDGDVNKEERNKINLRLLKLGFEVEEILLENDGDDPDSLGEKYITYFNNRRNVCVL